MRYAGHTGMQGTQACKAYEVCRALRHSGHTGMRAHRHAGAHEVCRGIQGIQRHLRSAETPEACEYMKSVGSRRVHRNARACKAGNLQSKSAYLGNATQGRGLATTESE